jgi:acyl-CoA thioester hydrolase
VTDDLRHRTPIQVRFRDTDAFGHVNNAVFFTYIELARVRYLIDVLGLEEPFERMPLILARVELDFRSPILFGEEVEVATQVDRIGRSSIAMSHRLMAGADQRLVGESQSVLVTYDYEAARPIPVPDDWRAKLAAHEGRALDEAATAVAAG